MLRKKYVVKYYLVYDFMDVCIIDYGDHQNCERCEATKDSDTNSPPDKVHTDSTYHTHSHNSDPGDF